MLRRFDSGYFALVLTCALALCTVAYVSVFIAFSKGYQSADEEHAARHARRDTAEIVYRDCLEGSFDINMAKECANKAHSTSRESERAEQNLNAQREMAHWSRGMLWAAWLVGVVTILITSMGVFFVKRTLEQAGDTNRAAVDAAIAAREANQIMRDEQRAWVAVDFHADTTLRHMPASNTLMLPVRIVPQNLGNTPAANLYVDGRMKIVPKGDKTSISTADYDDLIREVIQSAQAGTIKGQLTETLFKGRPATLWQNGRYMHASLKGVSKDDIKSAYIALCVAVCYKIPSGFGIAVCHGPVLKDGDISIFPDIAEAAIERPVNVRVLWGPVTYT